MMASPTLVYLPGLHGTADLAGPFLNAIPTGTPFKVIAYPLDARLSYDALLQHISGLLESEERMVLVGESFAGPLALMFAAANSDRVVAVVLCATFVRSPLPSGLRHVSTPLFWRLPIPKWLIRFLLAGPQASDAFINQIREAIRRPDAAVISFRVKCALSVDCTEALKRCPAPILYVAPTDDHLVSRKSREYISAIRPDVSVKSVKGPHLILQCAPARVWELMERFWTP